MKRRMRFKRFQVRSYQRTGLFPEKTIGAVNGEYFRYRSISQRNVVTGYCLAYQNLTGDELGVDKERRFELVIFGIERCLVKARKRLMTERSRWNRYWLMKYIKKR